MNAAELRNPVSAPAPMRIDGVSSDLFMIEEEMIAKMIEENIIATIGLIIGKVVLAVVNAGMCWIGMAMKLNGIATRPMLTNIAGLL